MVLVVVIGSISGGVAGSLLVLIQWCWWYFSHHYIGSCSTVAVSLFIFA